MTRNKKIEKEKNPPPKPRKPKVLVNLGRMTFIDEIIIKAESEASVGFQAIPRKFSIVISQVAGSPSVAYVEIQSQVGGLE